MMGYKDKGERGVQNGTRIALLDKWMEIREVL